VQPAAIRASGGALAWMLGLGHVVRVDNIARLKRWIDERGPGSVAFVLGYALAELCFVPGMPLTMLGGIVFGPVRSRLYVLPGTAAYALAGQRYRREPRPASPHGGLRRRGRGPAGGALAPAAVARPPRTRRRGSNGCDIRAARQGERRPPSLTGQ
jgi:hypothetical protein